jgi:hypothetical protein
MKHRGETALIGAIVDTSERDAIKIAARMLRTGVTMGTVKGHLLGGDAGHRNVLHASSGVHRSGGNSESDRGPDTGARPGWRSGVGRNLILLLPRVGATRSRPFR